MKIKIVRLSPDAKIPTRAHDTDAGYDVYAVDNGVVLDNGCLEYDIKLAIQPESGYHVEISSRSSISNKDLIIVNPFPVIDGSFTGSIKIRFKPISCICLDDDIIVHFECLSSMDRYKKGDKIAQLLVRKTEQADFVEVDSLSETDRGTKGFGSSGS